MALKAHPACLVTNGQKAHLAELSLQYFALSQFWDSAQTAPESALWSLSRGAIKIPWATDASGGFKCRTVLKSLLFYSFRTEQVSPSCLYQSLKWHSTWFFSISICSPQPSEDFCSTWVQWCPFLVPALLKHHRSSVVKLKDVLLWLNSLFSEANQFLIKIQILLHSLFQKKQFQIYIVNSGLVASLAGQA